MPPTIICLNCRSQIDLCATGTSIACSNCGSVYPLFGGRIPVFHKDWEPRLAASYLQYNSLIELNKALIKQVASAKDRQPERAALLERVSLACLADNSYYETLMAAFGAHVSRDRIEELRRDDKVPRLHELDEAISFFHRDWCRSERAEREIATIMDAVLRQVNSFAEDREAVLVPGAGGGRFAGELAVIRSAFVLAFASKFVG